jgi:hypothetical protein
MSEIDVMGPITLATLAGGSAVAKFDRVLRDAIRNIKDPNVPATKKRRVTLTVDLEPDDDREQVDVTFSVKGTLAAPKEGGTRFYLREDVTGNIIASEKDQRQPGLGFDEADDGSVN